MQEIYQDKEAKDLVIEGINKVDLIVGKTMGAMGKTVIIDRGEALCPDGQGGFKKQPYEIVATKDGVTVASQIKMTGTAIDTGVKYALMASTQTWREAGDGTTQTPVLLASMVKSAMELMTDNINPHEVKSGIEKAVVAVIGNLAINSIPIGNDNDKIKMVATISANNDEKIGQLIADVYKEIGEDGFLRVQDSNTIETTIEVIAGMEIPKGMILRDFITNSNKMETEYANPLFLIADYDINSFTDDLIPLLSDIYNDSETKGKRINQDRPLVIIANDFSGEVVNSVLINKRENGLNCTLIRTQQPYKEDNLLDIAKVTGGTVIGDRQSGKKLKDARFSDLGSSQKVVIKEMSTLIFGGAGILGDVEAHKLSVGVQASTKENEEKMIWEQRINRLTGKIGIIKVGGATEVEIKEKKDRVDDAKRAVESAIKEGIVAGGGVALIRCELILKDLKGTAGEEIGFEIVRKSLFAPLNKMLDNAGEEHGITLNISQKGGNYGYNIKTKQYGDMFEMGIVDPTKVTRCALQNSSSVACSVITSYCLLVETTK